MVWRPGPAHMVLNTPGLVLESDGLSVSGVPPWAQLPRGWIDIPASETIEGDVLHVEGWAATNAGPCARVELTLDGRVIGRARLGIPRPDVAEVTAVRSTLLAGFEATIDLADIPLRREIADLGARATGLDGVTFELPGMRIRLRSHPASDRPDGDRLEGGRQRAVDRSSRSPITAAPARTTTGTSSRSLRLLIFTHQLDYGGAQLFLAELIEKMCREARLEGAVLSLADGPTRAIFEGLGFDVHVSPSFPTTRAKEYESRLEELSAWIGGRDFDVAFGNTIVAFPPGDACFRLGLPTLWSIHESYTLPVLWSTYGPNLDPAVRARAEDALRGTPVLAFTCNSTRTCYERSVAPARCVVLPYGVDLEAIDRWRQTFDRNPERERLLVGEEETLILCMGTIAPHKGQVSLVQAFAQIADRHPDAQLVLVGSQGNCHTDSVESTVALHGLQHRVRIEPVVTNALPAYASADLMVSASDIESTPRSILEAMVLGVPVLSASVFGIPELITDGETGWLCEPRDVESLAVKLDYVLGIGAAERDRVAGAARALVEREYRSEICSRRWLDLLFEVAGSQAGSDLRQDLSGDSMASV